MDPNLIAKMLDFTISVQQIPAPTFAEGERAKFVQEQFKAEGLANVLIDEQGNVYGRLPGSGTALPLVVSAHLDTVFPASMDLQVRREAERIYGPGIGDNSLGVAGLLGLLWALRQKWGKNTHLPGDLWLVANVGEEGLGDLQGMRAVVDRFGERVTAYLVLEGMALGHIYNRALSVRRYRITACTAGGHSWVEFGQPSAIHELASLIVHLTGLHLPSRPRTTLNVGVVSGGISINTIASKAELELDLRSEACDALDDLSKRVEDLVQRLNRSDVSISQELIGDRPSGGIPGAHPLVQLARRCLQEQGIQPNLTIGSTDANIPLSRGLPAICLGISTGHGAHTPDEYIDTRHVALGLAQLLGVVDGVFSPLS